MKTTTKAFLMLLTVPMLWGVTFPLMHIVLAHMSVNLFVFWRFMLAGIFLLPVFIVACWRKSCTVNDLKFGIIIGLINSGTFVFQGLALQLEDSSRAAFLTGINVILVPLLLPIFGLGRPKASDLLAAIICIVGIYIISGAKINSIDKADLLILLSAVFIAIGIIFVEKASLLSKNLQLLTFYQIIFTSFTPMLILRGQVFNFPPVHALFWWSLLYCAIFATVIPIFIQLKYQPIIGSSKAAIIFSLEAVAATFFAWLFGETISMNILIGGGIILFSAVYVDVYKLFK